MSSNTHLVSVIIPCYNCEAYLEESLRSIINQTYTNLEIVCINDGSTDDTKKILDKLGRVDSRIYIIDNKYNLGIIKTLNRGIEFAKGNFICRMDSDDISDPNRIQMQLDFMLNNSLDVCGTYVLYINLKSKIIGRLTHYFTQNDSIRYISQFECPLVHPSVMCKSRILKINPYIDNDISEVAEDFFLWSHLIRNKYKFGVLNKYLLKYRINEKGESRSKQKRQYNSHIKISQKNQLYIFGNSLNEPEINILLGRNIMYYDVKSIKNAIHFLDTSFSFYKNTYPLSAKSFAEINQWIKCRKFKIYLCVFMNKSPINVKMYSLMNLCARISYIFHKDVFKSAYYKF